MAKALSKSVISKKKQKAFLAALAQTGKVTEAAHLVGYTSTNYLHKVRREDEDFAKEWDAALQAAGNVLEAEAVRRAVEGVDEPIYYKGDVVGYRKNYSDTLLMFMLRKIDPSYRDTGRNGGDTNINFGIAVLPMTAKSEDDWENRAVVMHDGQEVIQLEDKPQENHMIRIKRSD